MAPYMSTGEKDLGKHFGILKYFAFVIGQIVNFVCNCFEWYSVDCISETLQDDRTHRYGNTGDVWWEEAIIKVFEVLSDGKVKNSILTRVLTDTRNEFRKPTMELGTAFEPKEKEDVYDKAVENCFDHDEIQVPKRNEGNQKSANIQCPGGNGTNSPSKNQTVTGTKENKNQPCCHQETAAPSDGLGNNDGGCGGDGDDPHKGSPKYFKAHYQETPPPKKKDRLPESSKAQPATSSETTNENTLNIVEEDLSRDDMVLPVSGVTTADDKDERETAKNIVSEAVQGAQRFPDNSPAFQERRENLNTRSKPPYKVMHTLQGSLSVGHDGFYRANRDFIILGEISRGTYGIVYEILDILSGRKYALKKITCKDFEPDELKIWDKLLQKGSNVVPLLGALDDGKHVHIFMELMGGTLQYIADNREALDLNETKITAVMKRVLECLDCMHALEFLHADVKPQNIFFGRDDIKVGDFGHSLSCSGELTPLNLGMRGTIRYIPKEVIRLEEYKPSVDIYEAGGTMIYLLTGVHPWSSCEWQYVFFTVGQGETPPLPNHCSGEMKSVLNWMLKSDSKERPTAKELLRVPMFANISDEVLQELLVDIQLLETPSAVHEQPDNSVPFLPMAMELGGADCPSDVGAESEMNLLSDMEETVQEEPNSLNNRTEEEENVCAGQDRQQFFHAFPRRDGRWDDSGVLK